MSNPVLTLAACKEAFEWDGGLRDIYIHDTNLEDWQSFLEFIKIGEHKFTFSMADQLLQSPSDVRQILSQEERPLLSIFINGLKVNCHFFVAEEIELDIDPREVISEESFHDLMRFISSLGHSLAKEVRITPENAPDTPLFLFSPESNEVKYYSYG